MIDILKKHEYYTLNCGEIFLGRLYFLKDKNISCLATCIRSDEDNIDFVPIKILTGIPPTANILRISNGILQDDPNQYSDIRIKEVNLCDKYDARSEEWYCSFTIKNYF